LRIGIVADTHIREGGRPLPTALLAALEGVDMILHAGDICCQEVLDRLSAIAPIVAVHGNVDPPEVQKGLPARVVMVREGVRIGLTHGHLGRGATTPDRALAQFLDVELLNMIVFGHSHIPWHETRNGVLLLNPGSPTQPRRQPRPTFGLLDVENGQLSASIVAFDR
jgi:putative phosphoesterase